MKGRETAQILNMLASLGGISAGSVRGFPNNPSSFIEQAKLLPGLFKALTEENDFQLGQLVMWKPGLQNRKFDYHKPMIVVEMYPEAIVDRSEKGSNSATPYFMEPLDIIVGIIDDDGLFECYHMDSRRLTAWLPPEEVEESEKEFSLDDDVDIHSADTSGYAETQTEGTSFEESSIARDEEEGKRFMGEGHKNPPKDEVEG